MKKSRENVKIEEFKYEERRFRGRKLLVYDIIKKEW